VTVPEMPDPLHIHYSSRRLQDTRELNPKSEECFSYRMPAFRLDGIVVAGFIATRQGCSYFPFSGRTLATLADEVCGYEQTKGSLHFDTEHSGGRRPSTAPPKKL
jgi:uncharacterized protein YdhG (YjbR/CyaY superfamily)